MDKVKTFYGADNSPYLTRRELLRVGQYRVYLHQFHRADGDPEFHDHPWNFLTLILRGGYIEEEFTFDGVVRRELRPGRLAFRGIGRMHRIAALLGTGSTWTLVFAGPKRREWGFFRPIEGGAGAGRGLHFTPWRTFFPAKGMEAVEPERSSVGGVPDGEASSTRFSNTLEDIADALGLTERDPASVLAGVVAVKSQRDVAVVERNGAEKRAMTMFTAKEHWRKGATESERLLALMTKARDFQRDRAVRAEAARKMDATALHQIAALAEKGESDAASKFDLACLSIFAQIGAVARREAHRLRNEVGHLPDVPPAEQWLSRCSSHAATALHQGATGAELVLAISRGCSGHWPGQGGYGTGAGGPALGRVHSFAYSATRNGISAGEVMSRVMAFVWASLLLSEGQFCKALSMDRIGVRKLLDEGCELNTTARLIYGAAVEDGASTRCGLLSSNPADVEA